MAVKQLVLVLVLVLVELNSSTWCRVPRGTASRVDVRDQKVVNSPLQMTQQTLCRSCSEVADKAPRWPSPKRADDAADALSELRPPRASNANRILMSAVA